MSTDKEKVLDDLDAAWADLRSLVGSVPQDRLTQPGVVEEWSVKDLLGHMAFWAEKASNDLEALRTGRENDIETPGGEAVVAQWNAREAAARKDKSADQLRAEWLASFDAARAAFEATSAEKLDTVVKGWPQIERFLGDTTTHYREHEEHIRAWLRGLNGA